ncbi:hypothetical protein BSKO_03454 [Bryopsis sp. KO-2023]|nr:hypothetical protein BSKO_03454 [Bryopsis sp. KO-2023]
MAVNRLSSDEALNLVKDLDNSMLRLVSLNRQTDDFHRAAPDREAIARDAKDFFATADALQNYFEDLKKSAEPPVDGKNSLQKAIDELEEEVQIQNELLQKCQAKTAHWQKKLCNMKELREKNLFGRFIDNSESD